MEIKTVGDLLPASARGKADFSVAFGSFGCRGSAGGLAPFVPQARRLGAGGTIFKGAPRRHVRPQEIFEIGLSKCRFLLSLDRKWLIGKREETKEFYS